MILSRIFIVATIVSSLAAGGLWLMYKHRGAVINGLEIANSGLAEVVGSKQRALNDLENELRITDEINLKLRQSNIELSRRNEAIREQYNELFKQGGEAYDWGDQHIPDPVIELLRSDNEDTWQD